MSDRYLQVVEPSDNVATALRELEAGETVTIGDEEQPITVEDDVRFGHKIAIENIADGETIVKYGKSIGDATDNITDGEWVHVHNVESNYGRGDLADQNQSQAVHE